MSQNARRPFYQVRAVRRVLGKRTKNIKTRTVRENVHAANNRGRMKIYYKNIYIRRRNDGTCADEMRRTEKGTTLRAGGRTAFTMVREEALPSERTLNQKPAVRVPPMLYFFHNPLTPSKRTRFYSRYQQRPRTSDIQEPDSRTTRFAAISRDLSAPLSRTIRVKINLDIFTVPGGSGRKCLQCGGGPH